MTLSYTRRLHLAVPDFLSEPWHAEFAAAMDSIDSAIYNSVIASGVELWQTSHNYEIGDLVIDPATGTLFASSEVHTSSRPTFAEEVAAFPTRWSSFAVDIASQDEAEQGIENTHYMTALRTAQAIDAQSPTPSVATQGQAEEASDNAAMMTPLRTKQQITARIATQAEAEAGTDDIKLMTPLKVLQAIDAVGLPGGAQIAFSAHKNGASQTGLSAGVAAKVTFATEFYDLGNLYDTANSRWTPPAGSCHIDAAIYVTSATIGSNIILGVYKNGTAFRTVTHAANSAQEGIEISVDDVGNATDYYELFVTISAGTPAVSGATLQSYFMGHFLGEVSSVVLGHEEHGFRATKGGTNQSLVDSVNTKVTFGTEIYDQGGYYEPSTSRWTPPTGMVHITGRILFNNVPAAGYWNRIQIYKNGASFVEHWQLSTYVQQSVEISVDDVASGTDYYEIFAYGASFTPQINGSAPFSYFEGHRVGGPQGEAGIAGPTGPSGTVSGIVVPPQGRLTLAVGVPVMTTSTTGVSIIRYTPYLGDRIPIYDGTGMVMASFTELSQLLSDSTKSPAAATPETAYDMFVWIDSGTIRLSRGPAWERTASIAISSPATPATVTWVNHGLHEGSAFVLSTTGSLPTGLTAGTVYYVGKNVTATTFSISTSVQNAFLGTYINTTGTTQSGSHTGTSNDSGRGAGTGTTELARVQGMLVNAFGISHGPVANRGTYVGTIRTNAAGTVDWQYGTKATNGGVAFHHIWNCYNRVDVAGCVQEAVGSWSMQLFLAWRALNQSTSHRVSAIFGLAEDPMSAELSANGLADHLGQWNAIAVGFDTTLIPTGTGQGTYVHTGNMYCGRYAKASAVGLGYHYFQGMEHAYWNGGTQPFLYGSSSPPGDEGMHYRMRM